MHAHLRLSALLLASVILVACKDRGEGVAGSPTEPTPPAAGSGAAGDRPAPAMAGRGGSNSGNPDKPKPGQPQAGRSAEPLQGETDFSSADPSGLQGGSRPGSGLSAGSAGSAALPPAMAPNAATDAERAGGNRAVERGDIYRVLGDGRILNLNAYRGLQVIDVRDLDAPRIEGRLAVAGSPLEMYVVGNRAIVLLNNWRGYYGSRDDVKVEAVEGGLVLHVDIGDRAQPKLRSQAVVKGNLITSRLTQGDGRAALYVAATVSQTTPPYANTTLVRSFDVSGDAITPKSEIDLGGYVADVQATTDLLLVSSNDWQSSQARSTVSLIDISSPDGTMVRGGSVTAAGLVENKFNMDVYNGILRVVSGASWTQQRENHLETFSLADLSRPRALDHCTFGATEMLYATIFLENKGFFVTYFRTDPFHAFSIDDQGRCREHNEFIVSGWNDFLRPTLAGTRLIGIGTNDANQRRTVSVSLYDTTNLDNQNPLLARSDLTLDNSYSEAQWDDRAFSVIEDAVNARASDGTAETGLILVPFQGYDQNEQQYLAQVQILTFSNRTLTRRGVMDHGSAVRRSFLSEPNIAANLSDEQLRLYDIGNTDAPMAKGTVDVAPNYRDLFVYGDHVVRVRDANYYFGWYGNPNMSAPPAQLEVVPRSADVDASPAVAQIDVPAGASLVQVGNLLVSVLTSHDPLKLTNTGQPVYQTKIDVIDLSDPEHPARRGSLETDRIQPYYGIGVYPTPPPVAFSGGVAIDCFDCRFPRGGSASHYVVGDAIVFVAQAPQQKSVGMVHRCWEYPNYSGCTDPTSGCKFISGSRTCTTYEGGQESCVGEFYECQLGNGECKLLEEPPQLSRSCSDYEEYRFWQSYAFDALDLRNPDRPEFADRLEMDKAEEGTSLLAVGQTLYYNFQKPQVVSHDPRAYVKRYFKAIDFSDPRDGKVGAAVNVPGDVLAADGDTIYTHDLVWDDDATRTRVARLIVDSGLAYLQASRVFHERTVNKVKLDGAGHMLVSHAPAYSSYVRPVSSSQQLETHKLAILSADSLEISGEIDVDTWATFVDAAGGRALFSVSGGLLVINVSDPAKPAAQAYFPTVAWPQKIYFDGQEAMFAGGPYGIYRFDTDTFNLLTK